MLRMVLSRYQPGQSPASHALLAEKEIVRFAIQQAEPIRPKDVERHFGIDHKTAVNRLQKLCARGWMLPSYRGKRERIVRYELARDFLHCLDN